jgi:hypothetical protein
MATRRLASAIEAQIGSAGGAEVRRASLAQAAVFSQTDR